MAGQVLVVVALVHVGIESFREVGWLTLGWLPHGLALFGVLAVVGLLVAEGVRIVWGMRGES